MVFLHGLWAESQTIIAPEGSDKLSDVEFIKHDPTRPQPKKVKGEYQHQSAPSDAIVLFDGKNLEAFQGGLKASGKSKITSEGALVLGPGGLTSHQNFSDCQLHVEWRIPKDREVHGQKGSDSGIVLMDLFEIQILESYDNLTYPDGMAGAMYGERPPLVNAALPQGDWQSFDIIFKTPRYENKKMVEPAKLTLIHNGILVHLEQGFLNLSSYRKHKPYPNYALKDGPIVLKWDGDPVEFRNIWVRPLLGYDRPEIKESEPQKVKEEKKENTPSSKTN